MIAAWPYMVAFFAVSCYALMGPIAKKVGGDVPPLTFIAVASLVLTAVASIAALIFERGQVSVESFSKANWSWFVFYVIANFISYVGYLWAINRIPVAQFEMFGIFVPVIGGLFAWLLLKEPFHARYFIALALMAAGIFIAVGPELKAK